MITLYINAETRYYAVLVLDHAFLSIFMISFYEHKNPLQSTDFILPTDFTLKYSSSSTELDPDCPSESFQTIYKMTYPLPLTQAPYVVLCHHKQTPHAKASQIRYTN